MDAYGPTLPESSAVVCVDGITNSVIKYFTPDISWREYVPWLSSRRSELEVIHLEQPGDWIELLVGHPGAYGELMDQMVAKAVNQLTPGTRSILILGFSLGGLTALHAALKIAKLHPNLIPEFLAFVTFGTPYKGTARLTDMLIRHLPQDYFHHMFDVELTRQHLENLLEFGVHKQLRILIGEIASDEVVSASSSLAPVHWLTGRQLPEGVTWGTFLIECGQAFRAHDGLLHDALALAYIDGLVDGLLPPAGPRGCYEPYPGDRP